MFKQATRILLGILFALTIATAAVSSVSAQETSAMAEEEAGFCGNCFDYGGIGHAFLTQLVGLYNCVPALAGCHFDLYTGPCIQHGLCPRFQMNEEPLNAALGRRDAKAIEASLNNIGLWEFNKSTRELLIRGCGDLLVARLQVPVGVSLPERSVVAVSATERQQAESAWKLSWAPRASTQIH